MLPDLLQALAPREERITLGKLKLVVRELTSVAEIEIAPDDPDASLKLILACVYLEDGAPAFAAGDLGALKAAARARLLPLMRAVHRVNGFDLEAEEKNSPAAQD